jgi:hypothetical protein
LAATIPSRPFPATAVVIAFGSPFYNVNLAVAADVLAFHPSDEDLSLGTPAFHPSDKDLSMGIPVSKTCPAPENAVKMFIT